MAIRVLQPRVDERLGGKHLSLPESVSIDPSTFGPFDQAARTIMMPPGHLPARVHDSIDEHVIMFRPEKKTPFVHGCICHVMYAFEPDRL